MRAKSPVHASQSPYQSAAATKYTSKAAIPKSNFLIKVKRSKRRRLALWFLSVGLYALDCFILFNFMAAVFASPPDIPTSTKFWLGWNVIYNTQAGTDLYTSAARLSYSLVIFLQVGCGFFIVWFRLYKVQTRERDIGVWNWKSTVNLVLKLLRGAVVAAILLQLVAFINPVDPPKIRRNVFESVCEVNARIGSAALSQQLETATLNERGTCGDLIEKNVGTSEARYRGGFPVKAGYESKYPNDPAGNGIMGVVMRPIGVAGGCNNQDAVVTAMSFETRPLRRCGQITPYTFSNWITRSPNCSATHYNLHYEVRRIETWREAEQWFCNVTGVESGPHLTVHWDTAGFRRRVGNSCYNNNTDPSLLKRSQPGSSFVAPIKDLRESHMVSIAGSKDYTEWSECEFVQVSCQLDTYNSFNNQTSYWRSASFFGCQRRLSISPTHSSDQTEATDHVESYKTAYVLSASMAAAESLWDIIEQALLVFL